MKTTTKIAVANLKENKSRTLLISISIMLTTMLLTMIALFAYGVIKENKLNSGILYGEHFGGFVRAGKEIYEKVRLHGEFYDVGRNGSLAVVSFGEADGVLSYADDTARRLGHVEPAEGKFPVKENEIAGQKGFFRAAGLEDPKLGDKVSLRYRIGDREFTQSEFVISGFWEEGERNEIAKLYGAYISEAFYEKSIPEEERNYNVIFKVKNDEGLNEDEMKEKIKRLAADLGVDENLVVTNNSYLIWVLDPGWETIGISSAIAALVVLFSVLVIYNIFYVGLIQKIQEYGKLRAIGTTKKQIKNILLKEGMILTGIGAAAGSLFGLLFTSFGFSWIQEKIYEEMSVANAKQVSVFSLPLMLFAVLISFITVYLSLIKPMRIAAGITPVEALRYQEDSVKGKGTRNGYSSINVMRLTMSNLARNKKRTLTTIFTMGLSCILFVVIANVAGNMDAEYDARCNIEKGDFYLTLNYELNDKAYPENSMHHVQQLNLFGEEQLERIRQIDGVTKVETRNRIRVLKEKVTGSEEEQDLYDQITVLSKEDYQKLETEQGLLDYDGQMKNNEIACGFSTWMEMAGYAVGDEIKLTLFDGDKEIPMTFTIVGCAKMPVSFIMTEEQLEAMHFTENLTDDVWVSCEKDKLDSVQSALEQFTAEDEHYAMGTYQDSYRMSELSIGLTKGTGYSLLGIIGIIGFMNMANTLITSIITRRRELGILQAIGMTKKQLGHMLQMEGLVFTVGTLVVALSFGNVLGYLVWAKCKADLVIGIHIYHVPVLELLCMVGILLVMQMVLSALMSGYLQKDTLIERIRHQE
ncbi:MAG: FtsX-like permease family protein [Lachnospiraceae bacterium]|nr:FtsX-like permease family protein [Lachnospiraceae bacterium]